MIGAEVTCGGRKPSNGNVVDTRSRQVSQYRNYFIDADSRAHSSLTKLRETGFDNPWSCVGGHEDVRVRSCPVHPGDLPLEQDGSFPIVEWPVGLIDRI